MVGTSYADKSTIKQNTILVRDTFIQYYNALGELNFPEAQKYIDLELIPFESWGNFVEGYVQLGTRYDAEMLELLFITKTIAKIVVQSKHSNGFLVYDEMYFEIKDGKARIVCHVFDAFNSDETNDLFPKEERNV